MIPKIAEKISELKKVPLQKVYEQCRLNTTKIYGI
jgi:Tat protein secretion system quality control protein TatD with DNase activity